MNLNENDKNTLIGSLTILLSFAILILMIFVLTSCSVFESVFKAVDDNVSITWKKDEAKKVIDSLLINNKSTYFIVNCDTIDYEKDIYLSGYNIWILKINDKYRIEVAKTDSLIYLYGK